MKILRYIFSLRFAAILLILLVVLLVSTRLMSFSPSEEDMIEAFERVDFQPEHHFYTFEGEQMHYVSCGDPDLPHMLMIHGSPGSWDAFVKLLSESNLLDEFFVIIIDRPGYGQSEHAELRSLSDQSSSFKPLVEHYFSENSGGFLLGHSYGGALCLQLAADYPESFSHLILAAGTVADVYQEPRWYNYLVKYTPINWLISETFTISNQEMWVLSEDLRILYPKLKNTNTVSVILQGEKDFLVDPKSAKYLQEQLPEGKSDIIFKTKADHFMIWNDLELVEKGIQLARSKP